LLKTATVILLNGVGSVGKSSIANALQAITQDPFLHVEMDAFLAMMPERYWDHPDGITFETIEQDGKPTVAIRSGPFVERIMRGMRHAIAAMALQGNNLVVDDVLLEDELAEYRALLAGIALHVVGVFAPLDVLETRERERGDRLIGLARWQYDRVHRGKSYDLEIDAAKATPMECAQAIKRRFGL
jgi:chloramphenicol 3-O phosphotransferase